MAKLDDVLEIGGEKFKAIKFMEEPDTGLIVVEGRSCLFAIPAVLWDQAVRGALPFPSDEELIRLKEAHESDGYRESIDREEDAAKYIKALEVRARALTFELTTYIHEGGHDMLLQDLARICTLARVFMEKSDDSDELFVLKEIEKVATCQGLRTFESVEGQTTAGKET